MNIVSIILLVVGIMMFLAGWGLRSLVARFSIVLSATGVLYILDALIGWGMKWTHSQQILIAGAILVIFSLVTFFWQFMAKFHSLLK